MSVKHYLEMCTPLARAYSDFVFGASSAICTNGQWNPPTLGTCPITGGGGNNMDLTCPAMPTPFGGTVSYSMGGTMGPFRSGTTATLQCTTGFPTGSSSALCSNGQWNPPTLGTCSTTGTGGIGGGGIGGIG
ncbi:hypothetical protein GCK32_018466, partial [Trichostrongylus colubriformis]